MSNDAGLVGYAAPYQKVSDFQFGEKQAFSASGTNLITLSVPVDTKARKIYAWLWGANTSTIDYFVKGVIKFLNQGSVIGSLPIEIGAVPAGSSLCSVCTANGTNVQDCLGIFIGAPTGTQPTNLILQPLYIHGEFDQLTFSVSDFKNVTAMRAFMACTSSS